MDVIKIQSTGAEVTHAQTSTKMRTLRRWHDKDYGTQKNIILNNKKTRQEDVFYIRIYVLSLRAVAKYVVVWPIEVPINVWMERGIHVCAASDLLLTRQYADFFFFHFMFTRVPLSFSHAHRCLFAVLCDMLLPHQINGFFSQANTSPSQRLSVNKKKKCQLNAHTMMEQTKTHFNCHVRYFLSLLIQPHFFPYDWIFSFHICFVDPMDDALTHAIRSHSELNENV